MDYVVYMGVHFRFRCYAGAMRRDGRRWWWMDMVSAEIMWVSTPAGYIHRISCQIILLPRINMGFVWSENTGSPHCFREIKNLRSGIIKSLDLQRRHFLLLFIIQIFLH